MPIVMLYTNHCDVDRMLDVIGAQEALEDHNAAMVSPQLAREDEAAHEATRVSLLRGRNAAQALLGYPERVAWDAWRRGTTATREAIRAILEDLPCDESALHARPAHR